MNDTPARVIELEPILVDVKIAAQMVTLSVSTLNDLAVDGGGPPFCFPRPGARRYPVDALREWALDRPRFRSTTEAAVFKQLEKQKKGEQP